MNEPKSTETDVESKGGQGDGLTILSDPHRVRSDCGLVGRAVRQRWAVPERARKIVPEKLLAIVEKDTITVMDKDGRAVDIDNDSQKIAASRVLMGMEGQNQTDDHAEGGMKSGHSTTVNVGVAVQQLPIHDPALMREIVALRAQAARDAVNKTVTPILNGNGNGHH